MDKEYREIQACLSHACRRGRVQLHCEPAVQRSQLIRLLIDHQPDIVHFCGHGQVGGVVVEGDADRSEVVDIAHLAECMARLTRPVRCLLMNACNSGQHAPAAAAHVASVIGIHGMIQDDAATHFAVTFYRALATGQTVRAAFRLAQRDVQLIKLQDDDISFVLETMQSADASELCFVRPEQRASQARRHRAPSTRLTKRRHKFRLSVLLDRNEHTINVRYQLPGGTPSEPFPMSCGHVAPTLTRATELLDRGDSPALQSLLANAPQQLGEALFRVLFGDEPQWQPVLCDVFDQHPPDHAQPHPIFDSVHVHITTSDPLLVSLPWRLTAWNGRLLVQRGWRFMITRVAEPPGSQLMEVPADVIVIAPTSVSDEANPPEYDHVRAVRELLTTAWPTDRDASFLREVKTLAQLDNALSGTRPGHAIVYAYTTTKQQAGQPCMVLDARSGPDFVPIRQIARLFQTYRPRLVYLNTAGIVLDDPLATESIPSVIWRRTPHWTPNTTRVALDWLHRWLTKEPDPIDALHDSQELQLTRCSEAATLIVRSHYDTWTTRRGRSRVVVQPVQALDRDEPKAMIAKHLRELAKSRTQRALAIIGHAEKGNRLADLGDQLRYEIDQQEERTFAINWKRVHFPEARHQLDIDLPALLTQELEREPDERVDAMLRRHAPEVRGQVRRVLWLNWGVCGENHAQPALKKAELCAWLQFTSEFLATRCPGDLRVVAYLAIETKDPRKLSRLLAKQLKEPWARRPAFQLDELQPTRVSEKHLLKYLRDDSDCEPTIHLELAEYLVEVTGGDFDQTVKRLTPAANAGTWIALHAQLRRELGRQPTSEIDDNEIV